MTEVSQQELEILGLEAAKQVAGPDAVINLDVEPFLDSRDRVAYRFSFVIDRSIAKSYRPGEMRIRLGQVIRDVLVSKGDETYPHLQIMSPEEWRSPANA
jgi:hypothetical protein